jgi:hypothetical protein
MTKTTVIFARSATPKQSGAARSVPFGGRGRRAGAVLCGAAFVRMVILLMDIFIFHSFFILSIIFFRFNKRRRGFRIPVYR